LPRAAGTDAQGAGSLSRGGCSSGCLVLVDCRIALPDAILEDSSIVLEDGLILGIAKREELGSGLERIDMGGRLVAPGLIDIHTHGALGRSFDETSESAWETITAENARRGITSLLATLVAAPLPELLESLGFARAWMRRACSPEAGARGPDGSQVLGIHLESPYINPEQCGALDPENLRLPTDGALGSILDFSDVLKIFVLAPELPGALDLVAALAAEGILPAAGHSSAKDADVAAAMGRGLGHVTHIWSAMSSVVREGPWRRPGLLEAALAFDGLTVEMIADDRHLPLTLMKLAWKCIGADRLCAISDASSGAGLPEGARYSLGARTFEVRDGVGQSFDGKAFGGSTTFLNEELPILRDAVGIPLCEALRMASLTPARVIGAAARKGSIEAGKDADLAVFEDDFTAWRTMIGGRWL
jgi:N-acetylglucosamine-6-phosphate deacetylase